MASFFKKTMVYLGLVDDEYEDYAGYDEPQQPARRSVAAAEPDTPMATTGSIRTLPREPMSMPTGSDQPSGVTVQPRPAVVRPITPIQSQRVHVVEPTSFGDAQEVGDRFKDGQPCIVTLQAVEPELRRRLIDFCSGLIYALDGQMKQVTKGVYLLTPANVEVSAEDKRRLQERGLYRP